MSVDGYRGATFTSKLSLSEGSTTTAPTPSPNTGIPADPAVGCSASTSLDVPSLTVDSTTGRQVYDTVECDGAGGRTLLACGILLLAQGVKLQLLCVACQTMIHS